MDRGVIILDFCQAFIDGKTAFHLFGILPNLLRKAFSRALISFSGRGEIIRVGFRKHAVALVGITGSERFGKLEGNGFRVGMSCRQPRPTARNPNNLLLQNGVYSDYAVTHFTYITVLLSFTYMGFPISTRSVKAASK